MIRLMKHLLLTTIAAVVVLWTGFLRIDVC
jgi:hypothetical protein